MSEAENPGCAARPPSDREQAQLVLAADRTLMALERTYAAWVRTGLAALASGVAARTVLGSAAPPLISDLLGSVLILFSAFCFVAGVWRDLSGAGAASAHDIARVPPIALICANGAMVLLSLLALLGLWRSTDADVKHGDASSAYSVTPTWMLATRLSGRLA
jgi:putative membrane protein